MLEEVYGISREELTDKYISYGEASRTLHPHLPELPAVILKGLTGLPGSYLLPLEIWLAHFPGPTPLPSACGGGWCQLPVRRPGSRLYGVLGANDQTLPGLVQPGAVLEIDHSVRMIDDTKIYRSIRPNILSLIGNNQRIILGDARVTRLEIPYSLFPEQRFIAVIPSSTILAKKR